MQPRFQIPEEMIQRVQEILPQVPASIIARDLAQTRSIELTIDNLIHQENRHTTSPADSTNFNSTNVST